MIGEQLPLSVQMADTASFDNYFPGHAGPNGQALAALRELAGGDGGTTLIHGPTGCGKTHLLQATSRDALARRSHAAYLPLGSFAAENPAVLQGFETCELICLDDVDAPLQDRDWAQALLRLLDAVKSHGGRCLLSAAMPPDRLAIARLPDLRTRLCASACFALRKLDDDEHAEMLKARGQRLGLTLSTDTVHWMLTHLPRDTPSLLAALAARRQPTLPFVRQVLATR